MGIEVMSMAQTWFARVTGILLRLTPAQRRKRLARCTPEERATEILLARYIGLTGYNAMRFMDRAVDATNFGRTGVEFAGWLALTASFEPEPGHILESQHGW